MDISNTQLFDLIKYPIVTDKSTRSLEKNQYSFLVEKKSTKAQIKKAIELFFNVEVLKVNVMIQPKKKKRLGKNFGYKSQYKKAIVRLKENNTINLFEED